MKNIYDIPNAGDKAKQILNNDVFRAAIDQQREQLINAAMSCDVRDDLGRFRYLMALKSVENAVTHFRTLADLEPGQQAPDPTKYYQEKSRSKWAALFKPL